ncbi:MAG: hypothetical protein R2784_10100 [Saprospiraceae bacterium]
MTATMSSYLIDQINEIDNIEVKGRSEIVKVCGGEHLEELHIKNLDTEEVAINKADVLFIFIGAKPATEWLPDNLLKDEKGFLLTWVVIWFKMRIFPGFGNLKESHFYWKPVSREFSQRVMCDPAL